MHTRVSVNFPAHFCVLMSRGAAGIWMISRSLEYENILSVVNRRKNNFITLDDDRTARCGDDRGVLQASAALAEPRHQVALTRMLCLIDCSIALCRSKSRQPRQPNGIIRHFACCPLYAASFCLTLDQNSLLATIFFISMNFFMFSQFFPLPARTCSVARRAN